jgi:hypothetical protein
MSFAAPHKRLCQIRYACGYWLFALGLISYCPSQAQSHSPGAYRAAITLPPRLLALDSANGFRGYTFGWRLTDWPRPLVNLHTTKSGQLTAYAPAEPVVVGGLVLSGLQFCFYNGRLARLDFAPTSVNYTDELLHVLQAQYGEGQPGGLDQVVWPGQVVTLVYTVLYTNTGEGRRLYSKRQGQVSLYNNTLWAEARAEQALAHPHRRQSQL